MKKVLSAVALFTVIFLAGFLAALVKAMNQDVGVGACAAASAVVALISTIVFYIKGATSKKEGYEES